MRQRGRQFLLLYGPAIVLGLFSGRVFSELTAGITGYSLVKAALITAVTLSLSFLFLRYKQSSQQWPLFLLLFYLLSPEPDPKTAVFTLLLVIITYSFRLKRGWPLTIPVLATAVIFFTLYITTLAPGILPADNGEFQIIAANLGVAHPPGFSLYTMLAHLMTRLPLPASPAYKANLFSALTSAATLVLVYLTVYQLTRRHSASITAVLALGTATTFSAQATTANIRSLTGLFVALMIYTLVRYREIVNQKPGSGENWLVLFALALGLGVTHHASLVFMGAVFLLFVIIINPAIIKQPRRWVRPFLTGLVGLLPLLYFPLRAGADVRGASPGLATAAGFVNHILALGFRGDLFYFIEPAILWSRFQVMGNVLTFQFSPWLLAGMGVGLALLLWHDRQLALLLGGSFILHTFITATYRAPQTVEYMLPAYIPAVIGLGYGIGKGAGWPGDKVTAVFAALMLVTAVFQGWQHYPSFAFLHQDGSARDYAQNLLEQAPANTAILADWHWATPLWYLQEVEGQRPDVAVKFIFPEGESYAETWARRIEEEVAGGRSVIATHFDETAYAALPAPEPLDEAYLFRQQPRTTLPADFSPLNLTLDGSLQLLGYQLAPAAVEIGQEALFTIAWQPTSERQSPVSIFAHLVGDDGRLYAQEDLQSQPQPDGVTLTQFRLTPRLGAAPGDFAVMLGTPQNSAGRVTIASLPVTAMSQPPVTQNPVHRTLPGGRPLLRLIGYDWDNTLPDRLRLYLHWQTEQGYQTEIRDDILNGAFPMPDYFGPWGLKIHNSQLALRHSQFYVPLGQGIVWTGRPIPQSPISNLQSLTLPQTFRSSSPIRRDLVVSVRLIGYEADGFHWAWWDLEDSIPAMGAIPTLKWIAGSTVRSPHRLVMDAAAQPGQLIGATVRVYDAFTNRPLPILDERITNEMQLPWIPLGQTHAAP